MSDEEKTLEQRVEETVTAALDKAGVNEIVKRFTPGEIKVGEDLATEKPWGGFGEFLLAVKDAGSPGAQIDKRLLRKATGMSEGVDSDGGFLVEPTVASEIWSLAHEASVLLSRCERTPIGANSNGLILPAIDETSRARGSRWGGVRVYWAAEAATVTASKPKLRTMEWKLNKLMGLSYMTDELLADTTALESIMTRAFAEEIAMEVDDSILRGTGAGQPLGILNAPCRIDVDKETGQGADTIVTENIFKMYSRCLASARGNAVWFINQDVEPQLFSMYLAVGAGGVPVYMPANGIAGSPYGSLMGRPVIPVEHCSTLGDLGDIMLANLGYYRVIDKGGLQSAQSMHVMFIYDEMAYRFTYRIDGQPILRSAITPANSSTTLSPFVALAARA